MNDLIIHLLFIYLSIFVMKPATIAKTKQLVSWSLSLLSQGQRKKGDKRRDDWCSFFEHLVDNEHAFLVDDHLGPADIAVAFVAHRFGIIFTSPAACRWLQSVYQHDLGRTNQKVKTAIPSLEGIGQFCVSSFPCVLSIFQGFLSTVVP